MHISLKPATEGTKLIKRICRQSARSAQRPKAVEKLEILEKARLPR